MIDPYIPQFVKIVDMKAVASDSAIFTLNFVSASRQKNFSFIQGQFVMIGIPGAGECALDICSSAKNSSKYIQVTVKRVGFLTEKLVGAKIGDQWTLRGPFGNGWPNLNKLAKPNLLLIAGGSGLAPLRGIIENIMAMNYQKDNMIRALCGSNEIDFLMFQNEMPNWVNNNISLDICIAKLAKSINIAGGRVAKGMITQLLNSDKIIIDSTVFMIGPPAMYRPVIQKLQALGFVGENIFFSLERRMHCGIGVCQHCAVNDVYICKDGPVFNVNDLIKNPDLI